MSMPYYEYQKLLEESQRQGRPQVFDPALVPGLALRLGPPELLDPEMKTIWQASRRAVLDLLVKLIAHSPWREHLVLRGSLLLTAWLGDVAREPGDIDWVFRPIDVRMDSQECLALFDDVTRMVMAQPNVGRAMIQVDGITTKDIWTYERAMGRRIIFPWLVDNALPGEVQMDIVFSEELFVDPAQTPIPMADGSRIVTWTANKEISLAWKLLWLIDDKYPQGKDLYDATLLAEHTSLSLDLLNRVLESAGDKFRNALSASFPMEWTFIDWDNFRVEYSWVQGEAADWQARLTNALAPMFR